MNYLRTGAKISAWMALASVVTVFAGDGGEADCDAPAPSVVSVQVAEEVAGTEEFAMGYEHEEWPFPARADTGARAGLNASFSAAWDSRDRGWVTPVRNQRSYGTCWTFSTLASVEASILKAGGLAMDFSEKNLANLNGVGSYSGGNDNKAAGYLLRWSGCVPESSDPYPTSGDTAETFGASSQKNPSAHVQKIVKIPGRSSVTDNDTLKQAIVDYGVLSAHYYMIQSNTWWNSKNGAFYSNTKTNITNHAVALVGWNDAYSKTNFPTQPPGDGAWLIKNSWGSSSGDKGYMHISYYDTSFARNVTTAFVAASGGEDYTAVYGYDTVAYSTSRGSSTSPGCTRYGAAMFTAIGGCQRLEAVGFYAMTDATFYQISIYTNCTTSVPVSGAGVLSQTGTSSFAGFMTAHLDSPIVLDPGTRFSVVLRLSCPGYGYPIAYSYAESTESIATAEHGRTFYSSDGTSWTDFTDIRPTASFCCKACVKNIDEAANATKAAPGTDLSDYVTWLSEVCPDWSVQTSGSGGASQGVNVANGCALWGNWLAGTSPTNAADRFTASISTTNGVPYVSWSPDLGSARQYTIEGSASLAGEWHSPTNAADRFFRVSVDRP